MTMKGTCLGPITIEDYLMSEAQVCQLPLTNGGYTLLDPEDLGWARQWNWRRTCKGYVERNTTKQERADGMPCKVRLHRELLCAPDEVVIHHVNEDKSDNRKFNLDVMDDSTHKRGHVLELLEQGLTYFGGAPTTGDRNGAYTHPERVLRGERVGTSKLTEEQVICAMARMLAGETQSSIAREYGVALSQIGNIWTGRAWSWLFQVGHDDDDENQDRLFRPSHDRGLG